MKKSLKERTKELQNTLPLMEGREKGELSGIKGHRVTITDFGFMSDGTEDYVCFIIKESNCFYFGGKVLTDDLMELEQDGYGEEIRKEGLPILLEDRKSKNGRIYTSVTYYPEG